MRTLSLPTPTAGSGYTINNASNEVWYIAGHGYLDPGCTMTLTPERTPEGYIVWGRMQKDIKPSKDKAKAQYQAMNDWKNKRKKNRCSM